MTNEWARPFPYSKGPVFAAAADTSWSVGKNIDSYNPIFHAEVGKPFPITNLTKFAKVVRDHSLDEKTQAIYDQVKAQTKKENED